MGNKDKNTPIHPVPTDSDQDQLYYWFEWGDGNNSGWLGPYNSGVTCETKHTWNEKNIYTIKVKAKDIYGKESSWSDPLSITMPYSFIKPTLQFLDSGCLSDSPMHSRCSDSSWVKLVNISLFFYLIIRH